VAVLAGEEGVGGCVGAEVFGLGIELEAGAGLVGGFHQVQRVVGEVLLEAAEGFGEIDLLGGDWGGGGKGVGVAGAVGDVGQVAHGAGEMAFEDGALEIGLLAGADCVDEVGKMVAAAVEGFDLFAIGVEGDDGS